MNIGFLKSDRQETVKNYIAGLMIGLILAAIIIVRVKSFNKK